MVSKFKRPEQHYDLIEVVWDDAAGFRHGWTAKEETLIPQLAISVGFLIRESEDHILIAQDTDAEGSHNGRSQIPKGMVRNQKILRKKDSKKGKKDDTVRDKPTLDIGTDVGSGTTEHK